MDKLSCDFRFMEVDTDKKVINLLHQLVDRVNELSLLNDEVEELRKHINLTAHFHTNHYSECEPFYLMDKEAEVK